LVCLERLDEIWEAQRLPFQNYTGIFQRLEKPFVLYLALLLHDAGKADGHKNHAMAGSDLAFKVAKRLGLDSTVTQTLSLVIQHHLVMSQISQRRDLDDPRVIRQFGELIKTPENLVLLTLHTFVDSQATSPKLWNDFKETLLWTLYSKTIQLLTHGSE